MSSGYGDNSKHKATSDLYRNNKIWDKKDMASSTVEPMPQTIEAYKALAQRDLELIEEQQKEIGQLKVKVNKLEQRKDNNILSGWDGYAWKDGVYIDDIDEYFNPN